MPEQLKAEPTQDDINLFLLNELETAHAVLDVVLTHTAVPERAIALARLRVQMKQLERAREVAAKGEDLDACMELGSQVDRVSREIKVLESQVA